MSIEKRGVETDIFIREGLRPISTTKLKVLAGKQQDEVCKYIKGTNDRILEKASYSCAFWWYLEEVERPLLAI